jgi:RNA polymerase sigma-70 factor (ECF subfamily)
LAHFRIAVRILGDPASAEDVCQQAYLKALNARDSVKDADKLAGWLTRVIVNESLDVLRKRKRERKAYEAHGTMSASRPSADGPDDRSDTREQVALLLERLDEPVRTVVVMRTMQGMSGIEVKRALGCSAALVSRRLHQGLDQLREWLSQETVGKESAR